MHLWIVVKCALLALAWQPTTYAAPTSWISAYFHSFRQSPLLAALRQGSTKPRFIVKGELLLNYLPMGVERVVMYAL